MTTVRLEGSLALSPLAGPQKALKKTL